MVLLHKRNIIYMVFAVLWMGVIFWFSAQPSDRSLEQSDGFIEIVLARFLPSAGISDTLSTIVRKCAHFSVYCILGAFLYLSLEENGGSVRIFACLSQLIAMTYAAFDEIHQIFVPGRAGRLFDVFIDSTGTLTGILLTAAILFFIRRRFRASREKSVRFV